jgi:hypothetical protein
MFGQFCHHSRSASRAWCTLLLPLLYHFNLLHHHTHTHTHSLTHTHTHTHTYTHTHTHTHEQRRRRRRRCYNGPISRRGPIQAAVQGWRQGSRSCDTNHLGRGHYPGNELPRSRNATGLACSVRQGTPHLVRLMQRTGHQTLLSAVVYAIGLVCSVHRGTHLVRLMQRTGHQTLLYVVVLRVASVWSLLADTVMQQLRSIGCALADLLQHVCAANVAVQYLLCSVLFVSQCA